MSAQDKHLDEESTTGEGEQPRNGQDSADVLTVEPGQYFPLPPLSSEEALAAGRKYVAYTVKLPSEQLAALQSIWLELKKMYGTHSPDKSGMIQQAITDWLKRWDGPDRQKLLQELLEIRQDTRRRQYRK
jgi:hypothetical protein